MRSYKHSNLTILKALSTININIDIDIDDLLKFSICLVKFYIHPKSSLPDKMVT